MLQSPYEIRRAMSNQLLVYLKKHDPALYQHARTQATKKDVFEKYGRACLICGRKEQEVDIDAAHIKPVEEGGITCVSNLVPLCSSKNKPLGCHQLYDKGLLSRKKLRTLQSKRKPDRTLRKKMLNAYLSLENLQDTARPLPKNVRIPTIAFAAYRKERTRYLRKLRAELRECKDPVSEFLIRLRIAELLRRGRSYNSMSDAWKEIKHCSKLLDNIPLPYHCRFYYEYGYIYHLLGDFPNAIGAYERSAQLAHDINDAYSKTEEIMALAQGAVVKMLATPSTGSAAINHFKSVEKQLIEVEKLAGKLGGAIGNRWKVSCLIHRARLHVKTRETQRSRKLFARAVTFRDSLDATTGWATNAYQLLLTDLLISTLENKIQFTLLIEMCSRTTRNMLSGSPLRPEGVKDALIALYRILENEESKLAHEVKSIVDRTFDPLSGLL